MKQIIAVSLIVIISTCGLYAQSTNLNPFYLKVKTDSGIIRNELWSIGDSGISLSGYKIPEHKYIKAANIYYIKIKNFPEKPNNGGTPANDISTITIKIENDWIPPTNLKSFNVLTKRTSIKKNNAKTLNNKNK